MGLIGGSGAVSEHACGDCAYYCPSGGADKGFCVKFDCREVGAINLGCRAFEVYDPDGPTTLEELIDAIARVFNE